LNWHCYPGWPDEAYYQTWIRRVLEYQHHRNLNRPIWITEIGTARTRDISEDEIAARLVAFHVTNMQAWAGKPPNQIDKTFYFQLVESHGYGDPLQSVWALVVDYANPNREPTRLASFNAYQTMTHLLAKANWISRKESAGLIVHELNSDNSELPFIQVAWALKAKEPPDQVKVHHSGRIRILDLYGKPITTKEVDASTVILAVPRRPLYFLCGKPCEFFLP